MPHSLQVPQPTPVRRLLLFLAPGWGWHYLLLVSFVAAQGASTPAGGRLAAEDPPRFTRDVRPIFREFCFDCHGATEELQGGLDLRLVRFLLRGGDSGPAIVAGDAAASLLIQRVAGGEMPPEGAGVPEDKLEVLRRWIAAGAIVEHEEPEQLEPGIPITEEERNYWAFQPIRRPEIPAWDDAERVRTPIDSILRKSMPEGLSFSEDADRGTLVKRVYFDLLGLPPRHDELLRWEQDPREDWFEALVDEVLASPQYGQRWARHWLDVAGYADSEGYTTADADRPWAWKYRDYVVRSLNADKPFDQFLREQLAGDELAGPAQGDWTPEQIELLTATGFLRMAADGTGSGDNSPEARNKVIADTLKIVGSALLGVSLHCAQCHDHRYDPISQADYFALRAVFDPAMDWHAWKTPQQRLVSLYTAADRERAAAVEQQAQEVVREREARQQQYLDQALEQELKKFEEPLREELQAAYRTPAAERTQQQQNLLQQHPSVNITPGVLYQYLPEAAEELKKLDQKIAEIRGTRPPEEFLRVVQEPPGHVPVTRLFHRGDHQQPTREVAPAGLTVLAPEGRRVTFPSNDPALPSTGRRLAFARWLTSEQHPLLARVLVNRVWLHHFGQGLVPTPGDFGRLGATPSHPELLDWLAAEFRESGWSLKALHRLILTSTAWRQTSVRDADRDALDPENRFYARKSLQRLDAEILRDRMLAVSGMLDGALGGPPLAIKEDETGQVLVEGLQTRRSLYIRVRRTQPVAMLQSFDAPVMETNCEVRAVSTVATQSLMLLNGEFTVQQAARLADRVLREAPAEPDGEWLNAGKLAAAAECLDEGTYVRLAARLQHAWRLAYSRDPSVDEMQRALAFAASQLETLKDQPTAIPEGSSAERQVLANLCQMLLNSNEFLYVE